MAGGVFILMISALHILAKNKLPALNIFVTSPKKISRNFSPCPNKKKVP